MSESCTMEIQAVRGAKNIFLGGEGLFHTRVVGPGKVYIQSMPIINMAQRLAPFMPSSSSSDDDGGISIKLGGRN